MGSRITRPSNASTSNATERRRGKAGNWRTPPRTSFVLLGLRKVTDTQDTCSSERIRGPGLTARLEAVEPIQAASLTARLEAAEPIQAAGLTASLRAAEPIQAAGLTARLESSSQPAASSQHGTGSGNGRTAAVLRGLFPACRPKFASAPSLQAAEG